jgi:hypothetical protein
MELQPISGGIGPSLPTTPGEGSVKSLNLGVRCDDNQSQDGLRDVSPKGHTLRARLQLCAIYFSMFLGGSVDFIS